METKAHTFTDSKGTKWRPRFTTPVIIRFCEERRVLLGDILSVERIHLDDLILLTWYCIEHQAKNENISRETFFEWLEPRFLPSAFEVIFEQIQEAFPDIDISIGGGKSETPLDPGASKTS